MNKRQAKKGVTKHGFYKWMKEIRWIYQSPYTIPRHRQKLRWIKRQWNFDQAIKECDTNENKI